MIAFVPSSVFTLKIQCTQPQDLKHSSSLMSLINGSDTIVLWGILAQTLALVAMLLLKLDLTAYQVENCNAHAQTSSVLCHKEKEKIITNLDNEF